jgi:hypothetical protein
VKFNAVNEQIPIAGWSGCPQDCRNSSDQPLPYIRQKKSR